MFGLDVPPSVVNCGQGNVAVNGEILFRRAGDDSATGRATIHSVSRKSGVQHVLAVDWESSCLETSQDHHRAQFLSFIIRTLDGRPAGGKGFSASYIHFPNPGVYRIEPEVVAKPVAGSVRLWLDDRPSSNDGASSSSGYTISSESASATDSRSQFDDDLRELKRLQTESKALKHAVRQQKHIFWKHVEGEFLSLGQEIKNCGSLRCIYDAALRRTHGAVKMVTRRFGCHKGQEQQQQQQQQRVSIERAPRWQWFWNVPWTTPSPFRSALSNSSHGAPSTSSEGGAAAAAAAAAGHNRTQPGQPDSWDSATQRRRHEMTFAASMAAQIFALVLVPAFLVIYIFRRYCCTCRADRRWQRESRHRVTLFRRAHRRKAIQRWWQNLWRDPRITEYEEKHRLVLEQERILECAMQEEILQLRTAAVAMSSMVNGGNNNRQLATVPQASRDYMPISAPQQQHPHPHHRCHHTSMLRESPAVPPPPPRPSHAALVHTPSGRHPPSRTESLPDYRSEMGDSDPPPMYDAINVQNFIGSNDDDAMAGHGLVVDGFQYDSAVEGGFASNSTNSPQGLRFGMGLDAEVAWTPDSSVIATSVDGEVSSDEEGV